MDMASEHGVIGHEDPVAEHAVVADVDVGHEVVIRADAGESFFLVAAAVDGDRLRGARCLADLDPGGLSLVRVHPAARRR